jgi:hydrogenase maturation protease
MSPSILVAGIGNIFNRDDAFGVWVATKLARASLPENVRVVDFGIRGFDLVLALLDGYDLTIFVDTVSRGGAPGSLYTLEPDLDAIRDCPESGGSENAHGLDPLKALAAAKSAGARLGRVLVVGCEPAVLEDESGRIGLSQQVEAAVDPAVEMIRSLVMNGTDLQVCPAGPSGHDRPGGWSHPAPHFQPTLQEHCVEPRR